MGKIKFDDPPKPRLNIKDIKKALGAEEVDLATDKSRMVQLIKSIKSKNTIVDVISEDEFNAIRKSTK